MLPSPDEMTARLLVLLFGFTWHELAHNAMAAFLGDPTPARDGRLTLNPIRYLDPVGSLMLLLTGFGWSRSGPLNPLAMRKAGSPRKAMALVALAGPLANFLLGTLAAALLRFIPMSERLMLIVGFVSYLEIQLAFFNLIPIPPLDGATILEGIVAPPVADFIEGLRPYGSLIFIAAFFVLPYLGFDLFFALIDEATRAFWLFLILLFSLF